VTNAIHFLFLLYILERKALVRGYKRVATVFSEPSHEMNFSLVAENYKADDLDTTYPTVTPALVICQTVAWPFHELPFLLYPALSTYTYVKDHEPVPDLAN
jgi:hypothetical protein